MNALPDPDPLSAQADATVMIPRPGGRGPQDGAAPRTVDAAVLPESAPEPAPVRDAVNPLLALAAPLLDAAATIRRTAAHPDPAALRLQLLQALEGFTTVAQRLGLPAQQVLVARYALCTVLDEAAAATPWGEHADWGRRSLLVSLHQETWGGERLFVLLERLLQEPRRHLALLELLHAALALGFQGRYRLLPEGRARLDALRERLHEAIRRERGEPPAELSVCWRGVPPAPPLARRMPAWLVAGGLGTLLALLYGMLAVTLARASDLPFVALEQLRVTPPTSQVHLTGEPAGLATPEVAAPRLRTLLAAEAARGLLDVAAEAGGERVRLQGDRLFDSGRAELRAEQRLLLARVAQALAQVPGTVVVEGHTDDQPVRSLRFPSNYELSLQRAQDVAETLAGAGVAAARLRPEGRAEARPLASNDSAAGRARNRRVEILLRPAG